MANELARTISTCAIWAATMVILTFGLFRMNGSTEFFVITTMIVCAAAGGATAAVWHSRESAEESSDSAQPPDESPERPTPPGPKPGDHGITHRPGG